MVAESKKDSEARSEQRWWEQAFRSECDSRDMIREWVSDWESGKGQTMKVESSQVASLGDWVPETRKHKADRKD